MSHENPHHLRQLIALQAARMMAEDGVSDYAYAKKKAGRQLSISDTSCLPSNAEISEYLSQYQTIFLSEEQPEQLKLLRTDALITMRLLQKFNPHLTGAVLDGTAGRYAETHIHLSADSLKEVEMFLLNQQIPFETNEKSYRIHHDGKRDKKNGTFKTVPTFTLEGPNGLIKLSVFDFDDFRITTKNPANGESAGRLDIAGVTSLLANND